MESNELNTRIVTALQELSQRLRSVEGQEYASVFIKTTTGDPADHLYAGVICINTFDDTIKMYDGTAWSDLGGGGGAGEANTASNQGAGGVGLYDTKAGVDLQFKNLNAGSSKVTVTNDAGNKEVDIDIAEANIDHNSLSNLDAADYRHLSNAQKTDLTDAGDSALHYHATDRDRANHTGTQLKATISDFAHHADHENGGSDEISVAGLSGELADDQPPKDHNTDHENGGSDEISVAGLSGELADNQPPKDHKTNHENGGGDEISVAGLSGVLADKQDADKLQGRDIDNSAPNEDDVLVWDSGTNKWTPEAQSGSGAGGSQYYIDQSGGTADTYGTLSGTINGANTTFTVSQSEYVSGSLRVYLNGQLQIQGTAEDWDETNAAAGTFDFNTAPEVGDEITVVYAITLDDPTAFYAMSRQYAWFVM